MFILAGIVTLALAYWYYESAKKVGKDSWSWVLICLILFFLTRLIWKYGVLTLVEGPKAFSHSPTVGYFEDISSIVVAALVVVIFRARFLMKKSG